MQKFLDAEVFTRQQWVTVQSKLVMKKHGKGPFMIEEVKNLEPEEYANARHPQLVKVVLEDGSISSDIPGNLVSRY